MGYSTLALGLTLTIPTNGSKGWGANMLATTWTKISQHGHTGSGDGNQLVTGSYSADSVRDDKIRLRNNQYLRARNAASSADINVLKVNASDEIEFGKPITVAGAIRGTQAATQTPSGTTSTLNLALGNGQCLDLGSASGDVTVTLSNGVAGSFYSILVIQGATPRDVIWPASVKWPQGQKLLLTQTDDGIDQVILYCDGTSYYGTWDQAYA